MNGSTVDPGHHHAGPRRLIIALVIVAVLSALLLAPASAGFAGPWLWLTLLLIILLGWSLLAAPAAGNVEPAPPHMLAPEEQPPVVREVMDVQLAEEDHGVRLFRGPLREPADAALRDLKTALGGETVPLVQPDDRCGAAILLVPRRGPAEAASRGTHPWVHWLLFVATLVTTTWAGAAQQGINLLVDPARFAAGLPYAAGLLAILGVHEFGHYWMARRHAMNVTPPYFIPVPFALGTFGAFIRMRTPPEDRETLFDVAVAGPLAGLVVAIPALLIGLHSSQVFAATAAPAAGALPGSSVLFSLLAHLTFGHTLQPGDVVRLSPLAFAGWLGLLITALNLLPIGQLDGGHIARAMFGSRVGSAISNAALWLLVMMGLFVWPGLLTWAVVVFFIAGRGTPPLNDITALTPGRRWLGWFTFALLVLMVLPSGVLHSLPHLTPRG